MRPEDDGHGHNDVEHVKKKFSSRNDQKYDDQDSQDDDED